MSLIRKTFLLLVPVLLTSCYGYYTSGKFVDLTDSKKALSLKEEEDCLKSDLEVKLYFDGESINFEYEKIGLVTANGSSSANDKDVLEELKRQAKKKCCDAIIGIKNSIVNRESGLAFVTKPEDEYKYNSITYSGIAIKKKEKAN